MSNSAANASNGSIFGSSDAQLRYEAYSRLQAAAVAFGESLPIPEIVAIGGQSDGKSSLLEAFLGVSAAHLTSQRPYGTSLAPAVPA